MSETTPEVKTKAQIDLQAVQQVQDLVGRAHDYIMQATYAGHMSSKVYEVTQFLAFQYADYKRRAEGLVAQIEAEAKAELSKVDVGAAKIATEAVLAPQTVQEAPKA